MSASTPSCAFSVLHHVSRYPSFFFSSLSSADVLLFVHPFLYSWNFSIFEVHLSSALHTCKHHSHISFASPCVLSIYWVFLSLFIAPGLINFTRDLSLTHAFITLVSSACSLYLNSTLVKCVLSIELRRISEERMYTVGKSACMNTERKADLTWNTWNYVFSSIKQPYLWSRMWCSCCVATKPVKKMFAISADLLICSPNHLIAGSNTVSCVRPCTHREHTWQSQTWTGEASE